MVWLSALGKVWRGPSHYSLGPRILLNQNQGPQDTSPELFGSGLCFALSGWLQSSSKSLPRQTVHHLGEAQPIPQGTRGNEVHRYKTKFKPDTKFWTAQWLPGGNGQGTGYKAVQNLPTGFKHMWWIIVLGVFYSLDEECPVLQQLSPGFNCQIA